MYFRCRAVLWRYWQWFPRLDQLWRDSPLQCSLDPRRLPGKVHNSTLYKEHWWPHLLCLDSLHVIGLVEPQVHSQLFSLENLGMGLETSLRHCSLLCDQYVYTHKSYIHNVVIFVSAGSPVPRTSALSTRSSAASATATRSVDDFCSKWLLALPIDIVWSYIKFLFEI